MLPRLPRSLLQRRMRLPKLQSFEVVGHQRNYSLTPNLPNKIGPVFCSCDTLNIYRIHLPCKRSLVRFKSTNPKHSTTHEGEPEDPQNSPEKASTQSESSTSIAEEINSSTRELKKIKAEADGQLIKKSPEEDDKSKRRYEKKDPPEEERHKYWKTKEDRSVNKALMRTDFFDNMKEKNKENYAFAIELFKEHDVHMRGHVEFIYAALKEMKKFGVHRDLETYKRIIDIFPKGKMIQTNMFQMEFMHYPKHQQCAIDVLEQMEDYGVIPDSEMQYLLTNIFGRWSFPMRKASRMLYWMPKFKNLSPWPLPEELPDNALELAKLAVARMTSVDLTTKITVYDCTELDDAYDLTWIVSGQSPEQQNLIEKLPTDRPIYVEGAFRVWLKNQCMNYFILRADPKAPPPPDRADPDDVGNLSSVFEEEFVNKALEPVPTVHEQEDGIILGICCTGTSSRDSVVSWIRFLEQTNPRLGKDISVLFTLKSAIGPTDDVDILSYRDLAELKKIGKPRDPFVITASEDLGLDPGMPDLRQVGVWTDSETKFPNWPHHFHKPDSVSVKNKLENERTLEQIEDKEKSFRDKINSLDEVTQKPLEEVKKIKDK